MTWGRLVTCGRLAPPTAGTRDEPPMTSTTVRPVHLGPGGVHVHKTPSGVRYVQATQPLGDYPIRLTDRLEHWAIHAPERTLYAKRTGSGEWRRITYPKQGNSHATSARPSIAALPPSPHRHSLRQRSRTRSPQPRAMYAGVPFAPISTGYSLVSSDFKLRHILDSVKPGLVFASSGLKFQRASTLRYPQMWNWSSPKTHCPALHFSAILLPLPRQAHPQIRTATLSSSSSPPPAPPACPRESSIRRECGAATRP